MIEWSYTLSDGSSAGSLDPIDFSGNPPVGNGLRYSQYALDIATGDLEIPMRIIRGPEAVLQRVRIRFAIWRGEWFLNRRIGVPYREQVLVRNPDVPLVSAIFRRVLATTPGVKRVDSFSASFDRRTRILDATFRATLDDSAIVVAQNEPFITSGI